MEEIRLTSKQTFLYHDSDYKDIREFLNEDYKGTVNLNNILKIYPDLKKITFYEVSREIGRLLLISGINNPNLELKLDQCQFGNIKIVDSNIKELKIEDHYPKKEIKGKKSLRRFDISNSTFHRIIVKEESNPIQFSIEKNSKIDVLIFWNLQHIYCGIYDNSIVKKLKIDSTNVKRLELHNSILEKFFLDNVELSWLESSNLSIKTILIKNSKFSENLDLEYNELQKISIINKSTFKSLTINHKNANIKIDDCEIKEKLTIGNEDEKAISPKFEITNNIVGKGISFVNHDVKDEFTIEDNRLLYGKWKFFGFSLDINCKSKITDQLFDGITFQNCDFRNFDFQDTDIHKAKIINPTWNEVDIANQKRVLFKGDNQALKVEELKELKRQYSNFRKGFENENNYLDASKFKISEALTRIKILDEKKSPRRHLLRISKWLNLFGESIAMPVCWYFGISALFAACYLFTGFEPTADFKWFVLIDSTNLDVPTFYDFFQSLIFSLKNIDIVRSVPDFYLKASSDFKITQILTILQKIINAAIIFAFYTSMRNFFRK